MCAGHMGTGHVGLVTWWKGHVRWSHGDRSCGLVTWWKGLVRWSCGDRSCWAGHVGTEHVSWSRVGLITSILKRPAHVIGREGLRASIVHPTFRGSVRTWPCVRARWACAASWVRLWEVSVAGVARASAFALGGRRDWGWSRGHVVCAITHIYICGV